MIKYMLDTIENPLTEEMIKKYHFILKSGTVSEEDKDTIMIGEYKKLSNIFGNIVRI